LSPFQTSKDLRTLERFQSFLTPQAFHSFASTSNISMRW
jgi:hypothetical protein